MSKSTRIPGVPTDLMLESQRNAESLEIFDGSSSISLLRWAWATAFREILPLDHRQRILAWSSSKLPHWGSYWPKSVYSDTSFWKWLAHRSGPRTVLTLLEEFLFDSNDENHRFFFDLEIFFQTLVEHNAPFGARGSSAGCSSTSSWLPWGWSPALPKPTSECWNACRQNAGGGRLRKG